MDDDHEALIPLGDAPSPLSSAGGSPKPDAEAVGQTDNIEVEDMELSDVEEAEEGGIIGKYCSEGWKTLHGAGES